jgi:hypothetical protein
MTFVSFLVGRTMPTKHQATDRGSKPNLGQKEAEREKKSKKQLRHMEGEQASRTAQPQGGTGPSGRLQRQKGESHGKRR